MDMSYEPVCPCEGRNDTTPGYRCSTCIGLQEYLDKGLAAALATPEDAAILWGTPR